MSYALNSDMNDLLGFEPQTSCVHLPYLQLQNTLLYNLKRFIFAYTQLSIIQDNGGDGNHD
jgi:hypothetical protein